MTESFTTLIRITLHECESAEDAQHRLQEIAVAVDIGDIQWATGDGIDAEIEFDPTEPWKKVDDDGA